VVEEAVLEAGDTATLEALVRGSLKRLAR
jgi:hypothetical protein